MAGIDWGLYPSSLVVDNVTCCCAEPGTDDGQCGTYWGTNCVKTGIDCPDDVNSGTDCIYWRMAGTTDEGTCGELLAGTDLSNVY